MMPGKWYHSRRLAAGLVVPALLSGCATTAGRSTTTATSAALYWNPPAATAPAAPAKASTVIPEDIRKKQWGLPDVLDLALRNNPVTRGAWLDARSAAAKVGMARSAYYPRVNVDGSATYKYLDRTDTDITTRQTIEAANLTLNWLVLDFGSRAASEKSALETLAAANWTQNKTIQDLIFNTQRSYYLYLASKAVREARVKAMERAELLLKTARGRHEAGVATVADVLSAQTSLSQAKLALQTADGAIETTRGTLAVAMGFSASVDFDVEALPEDAPYDTINADVEKLINESVARRPDINAARSQAAALDLAARKAESDGLPMINLNAGTGLARLDFNKEAVSPSNDDRIEKSFYAGVVVTFPLFTGYYQTWNVERAKLDALSAAERTRSLEQLAVNQVFTAYHTLRTASQKVATADDLVKSAQRLEEVAYGRYKEGVGTILDLVTAQTSLVDARTQAIQARWEWHTALAQLAHDTGLLDLTGSTSLLKK